MKIIILGNSHVHAIKLAAARFAGRGRLGVHRLGIKPDKLGSSMTHPKDAIEIVSQLDADDILIFSFAGTMHNVISLLRHPEPFDVLAPDEEAGDTPIVTRSALMRAFAHPDWSQWGKVERFKALTGARMFHLAAPPPMADHEFILQRRVSYRGLSFAKDGLNPAPFRLKIWEIEMRAIAELCSNHGMGFLLPPDRALTSGGYLAHECYADDAAHANERYGELVLEQLDALCPVREPSPEMALA